MALLSWAKMFWMNTDGGLGYEMKAGFDTVLLCNDDFLEQVAEHIKDLVAAFDAQVKAHCKFHSINKPADVSFASFRGRFEAISLTILRKTTLPISNGTLLV